MSQRSCFLSCSGSWGPRVGRSRSLLSQLKPLKPSTVSTSRNKHAGLQLCQMLSTCVPVLRGGRGISLNVCFYELNICKYSSKHTVKSPLCSSLGPNHIEIPSPPSSSLLPSPPSSFSFLSSISNTYKMREMSLLSLLLDSRFLKLTRVSWFSFSTGTTVDVIG